MYTKTTYGVHISHTSKKGIPHLQDSLQKHKQYGRSRKYVPIPKANHYTEMFSNKNYSEEPKNTELKTYKSYNFIKYFKEFKEDKQKLFNKVKCNKFLSGAQESTNIQLNGMTDNTGLEN